MSLWPLCSFTRVFSPRDVHLMLYVIPLEASFSVLSHGLLSMFELVRIGLWVTLMLKPGEDICFSLGESFGVEENNQASIIGLIRFLLPIQLAANTNKIRRVVIIGKGLGYSFSFRWYFLLGGRNVLWAILEGACDQVFMLGMVVWFEIKVTVSVSNFPVDRHGDRAIFLSCCCGIKKGIGTFSIVI